MTTKAKIDGILRGYIDCALWSETDNSDESGGQPLDKNYRRSDIAQSSIRSMRRDVINFVRANKAAIAEYAEHREFKASNGNVWEHLGHDFWLNRNGHGTGFWDRDYGGHDDVGEKLNKASQKFGESNLYVGDDEKLYVSPER